MTTDICSIWAYDEIKKSGHLGKRQGMFLSVLVEAYPYAMTGKQIVTQVEKTFGAYFSKFGLGSRLAELTEMGFARKHDIVVCSQTHKKVNRWIYTGRKEPFPCSEELVDCEHCDGRGKVMKKVYHREERRDLFDE